MSDQIAVFLRGCPRVKFFNYFIHFTAAPTESQLVKQPSLECVGIHAFPCAIVRNVWKHLDFHFNLLAGPFLPALKRVVLHGNWQEIMADERFERFRNGLTRKGCVIEVSGEGTKPGCEHL
ncbi:hypothetical protein HYDPIDRAFT_152980 [Hydnomerulius pinastri MD-312]|uniref:Uncharacterized protein n=1 Tax=Hydnomerulius pinastri MD-312 TaxID=994086 RepID=A0A0C9WAN4_9AGAM|nr:hypothetical protein HYDPIDRAFT_152980 [Hydnomerulius pinastri MD-312]